MRCSSKGHHLDADGEVPQLDLHIDDVVTSVVDDEPEVVLVVADVAEDVAPVALAGPCAS